MKNYTLQLNVCLKVDLEQSLSAIGPSVSNTSREHFPGPHSVPSLSSQHPQLFSPAAECTLSSPPYLAFQGLPWLGPELLFYHSSLQPGQSAPFSLPLLALLLLPPLPPLLPHLSQPSRPSSEVTFSRKLSRCLHENYLLSYHPACASTWF